MFGKDTTQDEIETAPVACTTSGHIQFFDYTWTIPDFLDRLDARDRHGHIDSVFFIGLGYSWDLRLQENQESFVAIELYVISRSHVAVGHSLPRPSALHVVFDPWIVDADGNECFHSNKCNNILVVAAGKERILGIVHEEFVSMEALRNVGAMIGRLLSADGSLTICCRIGVITDCRLSWIDTPCPNVLQSKGRVLEGSGQPQDLAIQDSGKGLSIESYDTPGTRSSRDVKKRRRPSTEPELVGSSIDDTVEPNTTPNVVVPSMTSNVVIPSTATSSSPVAGAISPYACSLCPRSYTREANFKQHLKAHEKQKRYECSICETTFNTYRNYREHVKAHDAPSGPSTSYIKSYTALRHDERSKRINQIDPRKPHSCPYCGTGHVTHMELLKHEEKCKARPVDSPSLKVTGSGGSFACEDCDCLFYHASSLYNHSLSHAGDNKALMCALCGTRFKSEINLMWHERSHAKE